HNRPGDSDSPASQAPDRRRGAIRLVLPAWLLRRTKTAAEVGRLGVTLRWNRALWAGRRRPGGGDIDRRKEPQCRGRPTNQTSVRRTPGRGAERRTPRRKWHRLGSQE